MLQPFDPLWIPLKRHLIYFFHLDLISFQDARERDLMDIIENGLVTSNVGLNFSEPDGIIGQNHVYFSFAILLNYKHNSCFTLKLQF